MAVEFELVFRGNYAEDHLLDFYDAAQAMEGFQRSLALTTHLILNGKIITQAPALKNAAILVAPPSEGSWKVTAVVVSALLGGIYKAGTAPKDTPLGNLVRSAYDYVIKESLGFHVDYDSTLGKQLDETRRSGLPAKELSQARFDSLVEKCEGAVKEMHRPITKSETASEAIIYGGEKLKTIGTILTPETFSYISFTEERPGTGRYSGRVTSYNVNTYKGRIYLSEEGRPVPFELAESARRSRAISAITRSLSASAQKKGEPYAISFEAVQFESRTQRLKSLLITQILA